jgi:hypothetical protein
MSVFDTIRQEMAENENNSAAAVDTDDSDEVEINEFNEEYWQIIDAKRAVWKALGSFELLNDDGRKTDSDNPVCILHSKLYKSGSNMGESDKKPEMGLRAYRDGRAVPVWDVAYRFSPDRPDELLDVIAEHTDVPRDALSSVDWNDDEGDIFLAEAAFDLLIRAIEAALAMPSVDPSEIDPEHVKAILATVESADGVGDKTMKNIRDALQTAGYSA